MELPMIKLNRPPKPTELTPEEEARLIGLFKDNDTTVWRKNYILDALLTMSHCKCSYCETFIDKSSVYFHIDHFHPKKAYPNEVILWENLIPSCGDCNTKKSHHDTYNEPIIDPTLMSPPEHLRLQGYLIKGTDGIGILTVKVLKLNHLLMRKTKIGERIIQKLQRLKDDIEQFSRIHQSTFDEVKHLTVPRWREELEKEILQYGLPQEVFSATIATVILASKEHQYIKGYFQAHKIWDEALSSIEQELERNRLQI